MHFGIDDEPLSGFAALDLEPEAPKIQQAEPARHLVLGAGGVYRVGDGPLLHKSKVACLRDESTVLINHEIRTLAAHDDVGEISLRPEQQVVLQAPAAQAEERIHLRKQAPVAYRRIRSHVLDPGGRVVAEEKMVPSRKHILAGYDGLMASTFDTEARDRTAALFRLELERHGIGLQSRHQTSESSHVAHIWSPLPAVLDEPAGYPLELVSRLA
ncbi:MAG: hypothetical protein U1E76_21425 [Planctomycetota bacterium]